MSDFPWNAAWNMFSGMFLMLYVVFSMKDRARLRSDIARLRGEK